MTAMQWWDNRKLTGRAIRDVGRGSKKNCVAYKTWEETYYVNEVTYNDHGNPIKTPVPKSRTKSHCILDPHAGTCAALRGRKACRRMRR